MGKRDETLKVESEEKVVFFGNSQWGETNTAPSENKVFTLIDKINNSFEEERFGFMKSTRDSDSYTARSRIIRIISR